jgi:hypothetical protein
LAYATLTILKICNNGAAHLIEYDNPCLIWINQGRVTPFKQQERVIAGKNILEAHFQVQIGDILLLNSDGVINAGVGGIYKLGLGASELITNLHTRNLLSAEPEILATKIADLADCCYLCKPGDDSTANVIKARKEQSATVFTGPPHDPDLDLTMVERFLKSQSDQKIICGGASGNLVARVTGRKLKPSLKYEDPGVPPAATLEGVNLVTEGILTLNKCVEQLECYHIGKPLPDSFDAATLLTKALLNADRIVFLVGTAFNVAHIEVMRSLHLKTRLEVVKRLKTILDNLGKEIVLELY